MNLISNEIRLKSYESDLAWHYWTFKSNDSIFDKLSEAGLCPEYYPDEFVKFHDNEMGLEEHLMESPDEYFDYLVKRGEWFGHFYYELEQQRYDEMENPCWYDHVIELDWEEEYELFCTADFINDEESFEPWYSVQYDIKRCEKISRKKRKHVKDEKSTFIKEKTYWIEDDLSGLQRYIKHKHHKHLRVEKVYTPEEFCEDAYYKWDIIASLELALYEDKEYEDLMLEDWIEFVGNSGEVLFDKIYTWSYRQEFEPMCHNCSDYSCDCF